MVLSLAIRNLLVHLTEGTLQPLLNLSCVKPPSPPFPLYLFWKTPSSLRRGRTPGLLRFDHYRLPPQEDVLPCRSQTKEDPFSLVQTLNKGFWVSIPLKESTWSQVNILFHWSRDFSGGLLSPSGRPLDPGGILGCLNSFPTNLSHKLVLTGEWKWVGDRCLCAYDLHPFGPCADSCDNGITEYPRWGVWTRSPVRSSILVRRQICTSWSRVVVSVTTTLRCRPPWGEREGEGSYFFDLIVEVWDRGNLN